MCYLYAINLFVCAAPNLLFSLGIAKVLVEEPELFLAESVVYRGKGFFEVFFVDGTVLRVNGGMLFPPYTPLFALSARNHFRQNKPPIKTKYGSDLQVV